MINEVFSVLNIKHLYYQVKQITARNIIKYSLNKSAAENKKSTVTISSTNVRSIA